jgi:nucleotide-binding universal stress UspA family protein
VFDKIMIAIDGSDPCYQAAKQGVEMARIYGSEVTAVYVVDVKRLVQLPGYTGIPGMKDELLAAMLDEGKEATKEVEEMALAARVPSRKIVLKGHPSDELLRYSQGTKMDLLVMGSIGKSGLNRFLLGSVAEKVVQHSKVPILLVPGNRN